VCPYLQAACLDAPESQSGACYVKGCYFVIVTRNGRLFTTPAYSHESTGALDKY
jgi:hypothetical protein